VNPGDPPPASPWVAGVQRSEIGSALIAELAGRVPDRGDAPVLLAVVDITDWAAPRLLERPPLVSG